MCLSAYVLTLERSKPTREGVVEATEFGEATGSNVPAHANCAAQRLGLGGGEGQSDTEIHCAAHLVRLLFLVLYLEPT